MRVVDHATDAATEVFVAHRNLLFTVVGKALKGRRGDVLLTTKVGLPMGEDPNQQGGSRRWITTAVDNSLRRLGTDYIDIYQLQRPDPTTASKRPCRS